MHTDFITALSGIQVTPLSALPDLPSEQVQHVLFLAGLRSETPQVRIQRALQLYRIVCSEPHVSHYLPCDAVTQDYAGRLPDLVGAALYASGENSEDAIANTSIIQTAVGPGRVLPSAPADLAWPYPDKCTLKKLNATTAMFSCGSYTELCSYAQLSSNTIAVQFPKEFGIIGNIEVENASAWNSGTELLLPVRFKYPVRVVSDLLRKDNDAYDLIDKYDFASDFYQADRPEECIALVAVALYRELTDG